MADKALILVAILAVLAGAGWLFNHQIQARVVAETRASQAELAAEIAESERDRITESLNQERRRAEILADDLETARQDAQAATEVLEDRERLATLTAAKPGLLEIKAQKATTRVWETIEAEANARE